MHLCQLIRFCWHIIFCWISWFLLRQQIFAYSAIFCCVIIRHFDNCASFCWHSIFLLNQVISLTCQILVDTAYFLLSHRHVFVLTNQILPTQHILLNQLIFAEPAFFLLTQISFVDSSSGIFITHQVFAVTVYFSWVDHRLNVYSRIQYCVKSMM